MTTRQMSLGHLYLDYMTDDFILNIGINNHAILMEFSCTWLYFLIREGVGEVIT